jgi:hypothetical protein
VKTLEPADLGRGQAGVPDVDDEHQAVPVCVVPGLVLEVVVEHQAAALLPAAGLAGHADRAVARRHDDPQMAAQAHVGRAAVRRDVGTGAHARGIDEAGQRTHGRMGLDPPRGHRAGAADVVVAPPALVEEGDVPVTVTRNALALTVKARLVEGQDLLADGLVVGFEVVR